MSGALSRSRVGDNKGTPGAISFPSTRQWCSQEADMMDADKRIYTLGLERDVVARRSPSFARC
ncbi:hypothetical protein IF1G_04311 [Cordyceps javanica]|uniref:Uncharacterized protein n=1 Tax=Cordyceps javanica TaxID=43265 RepID=A0A545V5S6_9HYPO|nr:hypothetical protein IF1G_04311 [Cordyceps javanica]